MVLLKFSDGSKHDIPLEELQKITFFKNLPSLKTNDKEIDLSKVNKNFTYNNLIKCIVFSEDINDSCKELMDFVGIDFEWYHKNDVKNMVLFEPVKNYYPPIDTVKEKDYDTLVQICKLDKEYFNKHLSMIFRLPINIIEKCISKENINIKDSWTKMPLILASVENDNGLIELLVNNGADINIQDKFGKTPFIWACHKACQQNMELLIKLGADINIKDYNNAPALIWAIMENYYSIVIFLINAGVDVNVQYKNGKTVLTWASKHGYVDIVKLLINTNVNINHKRDDNETALTLAIKGNHEEIVELLKNAGVF